MFAHQKLKCYVFAISVAKRVPELIRNWPSGTGYLVDQLRRSMSSVVLNIAEGNGRRSIKERRRFFEIAIGSAQEVSAIFDIATALGYMRKNIQDEIQDQLVQIVKMLYKLK